LLAALLISGPAGLAKSAAPRHCPHPRNHLADLDVTNVTATYTWQFDADVP
jgi:hypothetical protein